MADCSRRLFPQRLASRRGADPVHHPVDQSARFGNLTAADAIRGGHRRPLRNCFADVLHDLFTTDDVEHASNGHDVLACRVATAVDVAVVFAARTCAHGQVEGRAQAPGPIVKKGEFLRVGAYGSPPALPFARRCTPLALRQSGRAGRGILPTGRNRSPTRPANTRNEPCLWPRQTRCRPACRRARRRADQCVQRSIFSPVGLSVRFFPASDRFPYFRGWRNTSSVVFGGGFWNSAST